MTHWCKISIYVTITWMNIMYCMHPISASNNRCWWQSPQLFASTTSHQFSSDRQSRTTVPVSGSLEASHPVLPHYTQASDTRSACFSATVLLFWTTWAHYQTGCPSSSDCWRMEHQPTTGPSPSETGCQESSQSLHFSLSLVQTRKECRAGKRWNL